MQVQLSRCSDETMPAAQGWHATDCPGVWLELLMFMFQHVPVLLLPHVTRGQGRHKSGSMVAASGDHAVTHHSATAVHSSRAQ
jgi:hypothetical protein